MSTHESPVQARSNEEVVAVVEIQVSLSVVAETLAGAEETKPLLFQNLSRRII